MLRSAMKPPRSWRDAICRVTSTAAPATPSGISATAATQRLKPASSAVASGTRGFPWASRAQNELDRFPNIGAAVISASTAGCTWKSLSAITPTKPPSISAGPALKNASVRRSKR